MPNLIGSRTTKQTVDQDRLIRDVYPEIAMLDPDKAPLITLLMKVKKSRGIATPRMEWYEDDYVARWAQVGTATIANTTASTTVTVTDGTLFVPGDMFTVPKAVNSSNAPELCRVTAVNGDVLTVVRDVGGAGADTIPASAALRLTGCAYEENSAFPNAKVTAPVIKRSYLQIFRTATDFSNTQIASETYGASSGERAREHLKKLIEHKEKINASLLFGRASESMTGGPTGHPIRTTQGLLHTIASNKTDAGGTMTHKKFDEFARTVFRYGSSTKILLAAPVVCGAISAWATQFLNVSPGETRYGVKIVNVETAYGSFLLVRDWMLENGISGQNGFGSMAMAIDLDEIHYRYLKGNGENRDTKVEKDVIKDGKDGKRDQILTEGGFVIKREKYHGLLYNVTDWLQ